MTDTESLADLSRTRSPRALEALVGRYAGLVYSTARRIVGDAHLAEDITQDTFIVLARKAHRVNPRVLPGWKGSDNGQGDDPRRPQAMKAYWPAANPLPLV